MSDYNRHIVVGRLVRDPELMFSQRGNPYLNITVASNVMYMTGSGKKEEVLFADYVFFGKRAEAIAQYFRKGSKILLEGKAYTDTWEDPNGQKRSKIKFIGDNFTFLESKTREKEGESVPTRSPQPSFSMPPEEPPVAPGPIDNSDIPF